MSPNRTGFTPLVVTSLVFGGIAIINHITAVAYPEWDGIDTKWHPVPNASLYLPIQAHGSLWDFAVVIDRSNKFFHPIQKYTDTGKLQSNHRDSSSVYLIYVSYLVYQTQRSCEGCIVLTRQSVRKSCFVVSANPLTL